MTIFVVPGERTFYNDEVHRNIPKAAKAVSQPLYEQLLQAQSEYKLLDFDVFPPAVRDRQQAWPSALELQALIDDQAAVIYANWNRFEKEHLSRENAAQQYKDAGFKGEVSIWIKNYADPLGMTYTEAADLILRQAKQQRIAQESLAALRMRKHELDTLEGEARYQRYQELVDEIGKLAAPDIN